MLWDYGKSGVTCYLFNRKRLLHLSKWQRVCVRYSLLFHFRHYKLSVVLLCFLVPTLVPWYFWGESLAVGYFIPGLLRYTVTLNATWLVNSAAHIWGNRPYDKSINPRENPLVAFSAIGKETAYLLLFVLQ